MKVQISHIRLVVIIVVTNLCGILQNVTGQSVFLPDSLQFLLTRIQENTKEKKLKELANEVYTSYSRGVLNDSLALKLMIIDSLLLDDLLIDQQVKFFYTQSLVDLFRDLSPKLEHPLYAQILNNLGEIYHDMGRYENALSLYSKSLEIKKKVQGIENPDYATSLNNLALLYHVMGQYMKALPLYEQVLALYRKVKWEEHADYATSLNNLALLYQDMGQYDRALPLYELVLKITKKLVGEKHSDYAISLNNLAALFYYMGQYEKALPLYEQTLAIRKEILGTEHADYAKSLNSLAALYRQMGQYEKALPLFEKALALRKKILGTEHPYYATILNNLASVYLEIGQYEKALPIYLEALALRKRVLGVGHPYYANSLNSLALLYQDIGQYDKALPFYEQALAIRKKVLGIEHPDYAASLNNMALLYQKMGNYDKALSLYQECLAITETVQGKERPDYATTLSNKSELYTIMGQYEKALPLYNLSLTITKKVLGEEHPNYVRVLKGLGALLTILGNNAEAASYFSKASSITLKYLNRTYSTLSENEKLGLLDKESDQFHLLLSLLSNQHLTEPPEVNQAYANELALKGMVLQDHQQVLASIRKSGDTTSLQLYDEWRFNKAFLGKQMLLPIDKRLHYIDSLQELTNLLEQQLSRRSVTFRNLKQRQDISLKEIAQKLTEGQAAIEFTSYRLYNKKWTDSILYAAFILLPGDSNAHFISLFEERQLQRLLQSASKKINTKVIIGKLYPGIHGGAASTGFSDSLYQLIWKPMEKFLAGIHTIYYAPAGLLHRIAFAALQVDTTHFLVDIYQLNQVMSTGSVARSSSFFQIPKTASLWGNIEYNLTKSFSRGSNIRGE